ncbi:MAG: IS1182 family transposase [Gemmatimonadales bacterium]|nr:IS1182 family transposase [Gemmatimonadales bacterium]
MSRFVQIDRDTAYLLPPSVQEWLPEDHLARFIVETVEQLDLSELNREYAGRGMAAFPPAMLLALLFYGYATGEFSSRRIERATYDSVAFRFIAANTHPDHDTIAAFRKRFLPQLKGLFVQILQVARALKLLKVGNVSLDGTKVKANASKHRALSYGHANRIEAHLKAEVEQLLRLAEQADQRNIPDGMDVPAEIARREARLAAIRQAKTEIEARARERLNAERQEYEAKVAAREVRQKKTGKKIGGKPPKPPTGGVRESDQISLTDDESRIMKTSGGGFEQAYNAQALTDVDTKLIVGAFVTQQTGDVKQIEPALACLNELPAQLGNPEHLLADTGYCSKDNVRRCEAAGLTPVIAMKRDAHHPSVLERFAPGPSEPPGDDPMLRLHHRLATPEGKALYVRRKTTSEPVFGVIKHVLRFRQFLLRGLKAVDGEWSLVSIAWNLRRMHTLRLAQ